ncbi:MAG: hypothetical protein ACREI9_07750 [Nitrospiraceae bacterium]
MLDTTITNHIITARQTTAGGVEETLNLALDGAAPAASLSVPAGQKWEISDVEVCVLSTIVQICLQESRDNGVTWFNHFCVRFDTAAQNSQSRQFSFKSPIRIDGAVDKLFRARVRTQDGAQIVTVTIRLATDP